MGQGDALRFLHSGMGSKPTIHSLRQPPPSLEYRQQRTLHCHVCVLRVVPYTGADLFGEEEVDLQ